MNKETVDALLSAMLKTDDEVSDLLFVTGKQPLVEIHGVLHEFPIEPGDSLTSAHVQKLADHIIAGDERLLRDFEQFGSCDCSYAIEGARFRVNIFRQSGKCAVVMRKLNAEVPTLEKLGLPPVYREFLREKDGIVLVTGSTGSGKSSTLAALLNILNETRDIHIVTLEDPIEFQHQHKKGVVNQRELGKDFPTFADGLRAALRQAPKVIFVGEIRDRDSMEIAMCASETGHLVFSTLHTINAGQTISRILGMFTREEEPQVRQRLSETMRYIASQRLVPKIGGGRLLATEVMGSNLRTREAIVHGESENKNFSEMMEVSSTFGWHTFDQSLLKAFEHNLVTEETAVMYSTNKSRMRRDVDLATKRRGDSRIDQPSGLKLNIPKPISAILEEQSALTTGNVKRGS